jgi:perosamine synthetase
MIRMASPVLGAEEQRLACEVMNSGQLVQGPWVVRFEALVAEFVGAPHAVAVSSGTAALHIALLALDLAPGDEVIVPDYTFAATANVVERAGAVPVLVDIDLDTYNIDPATIEAALSPRTRAVIPVHLFGLPAPMEAVRVLADKHGLHIIEDAACALGASLRGKACGTLGKMGCFSFHPRKVITTGEGGMLTTSDSALATRFRLLRDHGLERMAGQGRVVTAGLNYRMTDIQGAIGVAQMERIRGFLARRLAIAEQYQRLLDGRPDFMLPTGEGHVFQSYPVRLAKGIDRDGVIHALCARGVEATIGTYALSAEPHYAGRGAHCPRALDAFTRVISLPIHPGLSEADVETVASAFLAVLNAAERGRS